MKRGYVTSPVTPSHGATPSVPLRRDSGAVLRDVTVHNELRILPAPAEPSRFDGGLDTSRRVDVLEMGCLDSSAGGLGPDVEAYQAKAEVAASYQKGYEAGRADTESAQQGAWEAALKQGYQAGLERGVREGREQGLTEGREEGVQAVEREARTAQEAAAARLAQLEQLLAALPAELARHLASAEDEMVALCHAVVCRILGDQLVTREGVAHYVTQAVREASGGSALGSSEQRALAIHVHPRDLESLRADSRLAAWLGQSESTSSAPVRWIADEGAPLGGCLVRSTEGTLDARLETQLEALRRLLLEGRGAESSESGMAFQRQPPFPPGAAESQPLRSEK